MKCSFCCKIHVTTLGQKSLFQLQAYSMQMGKTYQTYSKIQRFNPLYIPPFFSVSLLIRQDQEIG